MSKTLVLFVYHIYNQRVKHFIQRAMFYDPNVDFVLISNQGFVPKFVPPYVKKVIRPNVGYDFGGWSHALLMNSAADPEKKCYEYYNRFLFVNSSVMGPFLTPGFVGRWTDLYFNGLTENVKLFGSTINGMNDPQNNAHVQSYIFAMDKETLQHLIDSAIFSTTNHAKTFHDAIVQKEIAMSRRVIERGWNIGCLMPQYAGVDFTFQTRPVSSYTNPWVDVMNVESRNVAWTEYQLVFIKGNRFEINSTEDFKRQDNDPANLVSRTMNLVHAKKDMMKISMTDMAYRLKPNRVKPIKLFSLAR